MVWQDNRNGNWDIYGFNISTKGELEIAIGEGDQENPAIYKDYVVWQDNRNGNPDIYGYNISTKEEVEIAIGEGDQENPAIYGDYVVWQDNRNGTWDIYGYNLSTGKEFEIIVGVGAQMSPVIYGNIIVWMDWRTDNNYDICGYNSLTKQEFQIATGEGNQRSPAIYENTIVWQDFRFFHWDIYGYNISSEQEFEIIVGPSEQPDSTFPGYLKDLIIIIIIAVFSFLISKLFSKAMKHKFKNSPDEGAEVSKVYQVDALKDSLSKFVLGRHLNYATILLFFFLLQVLTSFYLGSFMEIDVNVPPREKEVLLDEEVLFLPTIDEPAFFFYYGAALLICVLARRFFLCIPETFSKLFDDGIITKGGYSREQVLNDFNESLIIFENRLNKKKYVYMLAFLLSILGSLTYNPDIRMGDPGFVGWRHFYFFPANWILFAVVSFLMFFVLGIFMWKVLLVVHYMRKLNEQYELDLKPYDTDGLGGFKPLEHLYLNMSFLTLPIIGNFIILFVFDVFSKNALYPPGKIPPLILYIIFIVGFFIYPIYNYNNVIENRKENHLDILEKKIEVYYETVEKNLTEKEKDLDEHCRGEIEKLDKIVTKVNSISSLPFTKLQNIIIFLSAACAIIPWLIQVIGYFR